MRNSPGLSIANALDRDRTGIAVVYYPDLGLRDWLVTEVESIAPPDANPVRVASVEEAIAEPSRLALLVVSDERGAVETLDGCRDMLLEPARAWPVVLFLLRDGTGQKALAHAPGLASWIRGSDTDPEKLAEIDVEAERRAFETEAGCSPEEWLERRASGQEPTDARSLSLTYRAHLLVAP